MKPLDILARHIEVGDLVAWAMSNGTLVHGRVVRVDGHGVRVRPAPTPDLVPNTRLVRPDRTVIVAKSLTRGDESE
jgi:hypothetical protein